MLMEVAGAAVWKEAGSLCSEGRWGLRFRRRRGDLLYR